MTKEYAIAIRLNPTFATKAQELNATFAMHLSSLENPSNIPHITLYHGVYRTQDLPTIWDKIKQLDISNIQLHFTQIYTTSDRWIDWLVEKTPALQTLHENIVKIASPYHQGPLKRCEDIYDQMTPIQQSQVKLYGVSGIFASYKPHTTLFYQYPPNAVLQEAALHVDQVIDMTCQLERIVLGELGYNGNITSVIQEWEIS